MQTYNNSKFRELLIRAIGTDTKQRFSEKAGIVPQQLSRYLREDYNSKPSKNTLNKIAKASSDETLLKELYKACGYEETPAHSRRSKPFSERARLNAMDIRNGLDALTKGIRVYASIEECIEECEMIYSFEDLTEILVSKKEEYDGSRFKGAEYTAFVRVKFETILEEAYTWIAVYYAETKSGNVVILGTAMDPESLLEVNAISENVYEHMKDSEFVYTTAYKKNAPSSKEALFEAIFGNLSGEKYAYAYVGFGFYLSKMPENFREFLRNHESAFCTDDESRKLFDEAMQTDDLEKLFADYSDENSSGEGYEAVIAKIMTEETDLPYSFFGTNDEEFKENIPCVMIPDAVDAFGLVSDEYKIEDLKEITSGYARELGLSEYGEVHVNVMMHANKEHIFTV